MNLKIFSKGLCSSWCYHVPSRTLFDAGDGVGTYMHNDLYGIERICIGHQDADHTLGLISLIGIRNKARGDRGKPLTVYYPQTELLQGLVDYIIKRNGNWLSYDITWVPVKPGDVIPLSGTKQFIRVFEVQHNPNSLCLGYVVCENRTRLTPEAKAHVPNIPQALAAGLISKDTMYENYEAKLFAYTLDNYTFDSKNIEGVSLLVTDATFLDAGDRIDPTHASIYEAANLASGAAVKEVLFAHISPRYSVDKIENFKFDIELPFKYRIITHDKVHIL